MRTLALLLTLVPSLTAAAPVFIFDAAGDRVLAARPLPTLPNTDPPPRFDVRLFVRGRLEPWPFDDRPLGAARLLPDGALALTPEGRLLRLRDGREALLDEGALGPVGVSPDGRFVVYCKGESPAVEVWRHDEKGARPVTTDMAPTWSPAISPDGRAVVFVSARSGWPALWRIDDGGPPRPLTPLEGPAAPGQAPAPEPFPDAMTAPLLAGEWLVFEGAGAVHVRGEKARRTLEGATAPHWIEPGRVLGVFQNGRHVTVDLAEVAK